MRKNSNVKQMISLLQDMSLEEKQDVVEQILAMMAGTASGAAGEAKKARKGEDAELRPDCPHCRAEAKLGYIVKRGKFDGKQRFYCKSCGKTFVATTKTAFAQTHKSEAVWRKFIQMTLACKSLKACAEECGIAHQTAFTWRHKILNVFKVHQASTEMTGRVELDEMLIPISYKGNRVKGKVGSKRTRLPGEDNGLPRRSFARGSDNKSKSSKDKACVFCMVEDGNKAFYAAVPGTGFMSVPMLDHTIGKHVRKDSAILLADTYKVTQKYLQDESYRFMTLLSNTTDNTHDHKPEIRNGYHLQHVNAFHHHLRDFLRPYCGVSTKYLENYVSLFVWIKSNQAARQSKRIKTISIARAATSDCYISKCELDRLPAVPCCA